MSERLLPEARDRAGDARTRVVIVAFWALALVLGGLRAWQTRYQMDIDSISYLDMGDAYLRRDWAMALNGSWNPLYAWLLSLGKLVFHPNPYWEFPFLHLVNFGIYVAGLGCLHFFLVQFLRRTRLLDDSPRWRGSPSVPAWALLALGYSLYVWSSLELIDFREGADLCLAALIYLAFGLLLRIQAGPGGWKPFIALGLVLGFGYLTKPVMLPLAFVFLATAGLGAADRRRALPQVLAALLVFGAIAGPFVAALSKSKGRFTYGDAGKVWYALFVTLDFQDHWDPPYFPWQGGLRDTGVPKHPIRKIFSSPDVYEFDRPFQATYAPFYDPTYWYEGIVPRFHLRNQIRVLMWNARKYFQLFVLARPALVAGLFILFWMSWSPGFRPRDPMISAILLPPALAAFGLYGLVHYVEERYVAVFIVVTWLALIAAVPLPDAQDSRRLLAGVIAGMVFAALLEGLWGSSRDLNRLRDRPDDKDVRLAIRLADLGVRPGSKVALIGERTISAASVVFAMRLARVRIIAEITRKDAPVYWTANEALKGRVMEAFASAGVEAVFSDSIPSWASTAGWLKIDGFGDGYSAYVHPLSPSVARAALATLPPRKHSAENE